MKVNRLFSYQFSPPPNPTASFYIYIVMPLLVKRVLSRNNMVKPIQRHLLHRHFLRGWHNLGTVTPRQKITGQYT